MSDTLIWREEFNEHLHNQLPFLEMTLRLLHQFLEKIDMSHPYPLLMSRKMISQQTCSVKASTSVEKILLWEILQ